jgi:hypothetical protein
MSTVLFLNACKVIYLGQVKAVISALPGKARGTQ